MLAKSLSGALSVTPPDTDSDFENTVLLLHGDGTNGAQNNTFTDSSTNAFSITRNGNTTQGTFSPFSQTGWSNYFDGTGDYLTVATNAAFRFGTGDFTIEMWVNTTDTTFALYEDGYKNSGTYNTTAIYYTSGDLYWVYGPSGGNGVVIASATTSVINDGKWHHLAVSRSGTSAKMFLDGTQIGSTATNSTNFNSESTVNIGRLSNFAGYDLDGYISNLRVVKGTAVYTAAFTPPTSALTAITNTSLLTCQSNRFKDNSTNAFTITVNGNPSVQAFSPFAPSAAYSASTNGGSGYFDGSGDYLELASNSAWALGTGDFTVSCWVYFNDHSRQQIVGNLTTNSYTTWGLYLQDGGLAFSNYYASPVVTYDSNAFAMRQWNWIEVSRVSGTYYMFINGVEVDNGTASPAQDYSSTTGIIIGDDVNWTYAGPLNGYLSDLRIVKGSGITSSTVPTAPISAITNTQFLCKFQNAGIIDNTAKNVLETVGNAQIDTGTKKFGTGSMKFDGTGDLLKSSKFVHGLGSGNFTIEWWSYVTSVSGFYYVFDYGTESSVRLSGFLSNGNNGYYGLVLYTDGYKGSTSSGNAPPTSQWVHYAVVRNGSTISIYQNGTSIYSYTDSRDLTKNDIWYIGGDEGVSQTLNGYIDDFRVTTGVARYTANFTPPTEAFPDQ